MNFKQLKDITTITKGTRNSRDALRKATSIIRRISIERKFLQFHHKYHKDISSERNKPKPQQLHMKAFMPRSNLHKVEY